MEYATRKRVWPAGSRGGFTLVELLVVIGIIAVLAALVTPAVMRAQVTARNAAIKAEIDMLHMAIMNYKNEYGSFPPCSDDLLSNAGLATKHLQRVFPRALNGTAQLDGILKDQGATPVAITPTNSLAFWLSGFTKDPVYPLFYLPDPTKKAPRTKLYDFDTSRLNSKSGAYAPTGKSGSPYIYIDSNNYANFPYDASNPDQVRAQRVPTTPLSTNMLANFANTSASFANPDTFQILCAGRDEQFGTDDDLSNFWPGTRRDYLDSLQQ